MSLFQPSTAEVLRIVQAEFYHLGVCMSDLHSVEERTRVDRGQVVARSYRAGDLMAMWLIEIGLLQFYGAEGEMLATINLLEQETPLRRAA